MKRHVYLRIVLSMLVLLLLLLLWMNQWRYEQRGFFKINRITGKAYQLQSDGEWKSLKQLAREQEEEKIRLKREAKNREAERNRLESLMNMSEEERMKAIEEFLKEKGILNKDGSINKEAIKKLEEPKE